MSNIRADYRLNAIVKKFSQLQPQFDANLWQPNYSGNYAQLGQNFLAPKKVEKGLIERNFHLCTECTTTM